MVDMCLIIRPWSIWLHTICIQVGTIYMDNTKKKGDLEPYSREEKSRNFSKLRRNFFWGGRKTTASILMLSTTVLVQSKLMSFLASLNCPVAQTKLDTSYCMNMMHMPHNTILLLLIRTSFWSLHMPPMWTP